MTDFLRTSIEDFDHAALEQIKEHAQLILTADKKQPDDGKHSDIRAALQDVVRGLAMLNTVHQQNLTKARIDNQADRIAGYNAAINSTLSTDQQEVTK